MKLFYHSDFFINFDKVMYFTRQYSNLEVTLFFDHDHMLKLNFEDADQMSYFINNVLGGNDD